MDLDDPKTRWTQSPVARETAESDIGYLFTLYRLDSRRIVTREELADELTEEAKGVPEKPWMDGEFNCYDYITECVLVGIYEQVAVHPEAAAECTDGVSRWTLNGLSEVGPCRRAVCGLAFSHVEDWCSAGD